MLRLQRFIVWPWPPECQDPSYPLHGNCSGFPTETVSQFIARGAIRARELHFDQSMCRERTIDFSQYRLGRTGLTDLDDGVERVGARFQLRPLAGSQVSGHGEK